MNETVGKYINCSTEMADNASSIFYTQKFRLITVTITEVITAVEAMAVVIITIIMEIIIPAITAKITITTTTTIEDEGITE